MFYGDTTVFTGEMDLQQLVSFSLFPNPANENIVIKAAKEIQDKQLFIIQDLSGKEILRRQLFSQQTTISVADLPVGMYICTLVDEKGYAGNSKLIISR
jgi:hypothetical protein